MGSFLALTADPLSWKLKFSLTLSYQQFRQAILTPKIRPSRNQTKSQNARIVFDLDGTLIDSAPDIQGIANTVLTGMGADPITLEDTRSFIGEGIAAFV